jgi:hypothetical protein
MIAAKETLDAENPAHMAAARAMRDALAPINDLPGHEREKREQEEAIRTLAATGFPGKLITGRRKQSS